MNLFRFGRKRPEGRSNTPNNPATSLTGSGILGWLTGGMSDAGEVVSEQSALGIATVYACVRVLSESLASLPCKVFHVTDKGRLQATDHRLQYLLGTAPNDEMTAFTFFEVMVKAMALVGNAYAEIERDSEGQPVALWPLHPRETQPIRQGDGRLAYRTADGMSGGQVRIVSAENMIHVPLFPDFDGIVGLSPLQLNMQTFGQAIATERFGSRFFRNYATPAIALTTAEEVDGKTKTEMRADWEKLQSAGNQHRVAILDQGLKLERLSLSPEEGQYLETRCFLRSEIASLFRVPSHMVGDNAKLSNANTENLNLSFVVDSLRPYLSRLEAELTRKLFPVTHPVPQMFAVQFDVSERQRGDFASSMAGFASGRQFGWLTANDVRRALGLNEGGPELDVFLNPVNMQNANRLLSNAPTPPAAN